MLIYFGDREMKPNFQKLPIGSLQRLCVPLEAYKRNNPGENIPSFERLPNKSTPESEDERRGWVGLI
jgi:hypothetical protein